MNRQTPGMRIALGMALIMVLPCNAFAVTLQNRIDAAGATAENHALCTRLPNFYWEIGDSSGPLATGTTGLNPPSSDTRMKIASASKWLWGAYVAEKRNGLLSATDTRALTMSNGYINWIGCKPGQSVAQCQSRLLNGRYTAARDGLFHYGGAPFQKQAVDLGLGPMSNLALQQEMQAYLGNDIDFSFDNPSPAGGGNASASGYAIFLRKLLDGTLKLSGLLGSSAVCTYTGSDDAGTGRMHCDTADSSPADEDLHYSLGHWVEDDPVTGDGAFSSPGAFGFYPWIDSTQTYYGILARKTVLTNGYWPSVECGRIIRKAWASGQPPQ